MSTENALTVFQASPEVALQFIETIGRSFAQGGLPGCKGPGQGQALALTCLMEGLTPLQFMLQYHLIEGKPSKQATTLLGEFESAGGKVKWINIGDDGREAKATWKYGDHDITIAYTVEEARRQVSKNKFEDPNSNYSKNLGSMLRSRLITKALRIVAPGLVAGIYTPEELGHDEEQADFVVIDSPGVLEKIESKAAPKEEAGGKAPEKKRKRSTKKPTTSTDLKESTPEPTESRQSTNQDSKTGSSESTESGIADEPTDDVELTAEQLDEVVDAELAVRGEKLMKESEENAKLKEPEIDAGLPPDLATQKQLDEMKTLVIQMSYESKFTDALKRIGLEEPKELTREQASMWLERLRQLSADS